MEQARCPNCSQPVPDGARFCPACGTTLAARVDAAERRVVTAIFADLAGSTRLGEQLDAEILRNVVSEFFEIAGREIRGHGGTVEQFSGDAAVGIFGLTSSHEDDGERAVRTAMAIVKAIEPLQAAVRDQHRVGLDVATSPTHCSSWAPRSSGTMTGRRLLAPKWSSGSYAHGRGAPRRPRPSFARPWR